ncbi:MAG: CGLD27 family protein [Cyanobacteria bacterium P01_F01_bin.42]
MNTSLRPCPVPLEQQPLNEYKSLLNSWFFQWSAMPSADYFKTLMLIWLGSWLLSLPFAAEALFTEPSLAKTLLAANAGATTLLLLTLIRLYLGWRYIRDRLESSVVAYEESGWYDGRTWQKTEAQRNREKLISVYEVQPIMHRLLMSLTAVIAVAVAGASAWPLI